MASLLKDLYSQTFIETLASDISRFYPNFKIQNFTSDIFNNTWEQKELKQRMRHISTTMYQYIKLDYKKTVEVLILCFDFRKISKEKKHENLGLENMIFADMIEVFGLDDFEVSMQAMECFTQYSSSEFAIRQFILKYEDNTMKQMKEWTKSKSEHTRRLASEGCRPRLPWAIALPIYKNNPTKVIEILELLKNDSSKYVQKSVANNLNDISKDNIHTVKKLANKNEHFATNFTKSIQQKTSISENTRIKILSKNNDETIIIDLKQLLCVKSEGNYLKVFFLKENIIKSKLIRNSFSKIEEQLVVFEKVKRCHRSYIVNLDKVEKMTGNARNLNLHISNLDFTIPVSRSFPKEVFIDLNI